MITMRCLSIFPIACALALTACALADTPATTQPATRPATTTRGANRLIVRVIPAADGSWTAQVGIFKAGDRETLRERLRFTHAALRADTDPVDCWFSVRGTYDAAVAKELELAAKDLGFASVEVWFIQRVPGREPGIITPNGPPIAPFGIRRHRPRAPRPDRAPPLDLPLNPATDSDPRFKKLLTEWSPRRREENRAEENRDAAS